MYLPQMAANPHFYDYMHYLLFQQDSSVKLVAGAGQAMIIVVHGNYDVCVLGQDSAEVTFHNLVEVNPYREEETRGDIQEFKVNVTREQGTFSFGEEFSQTRDEEQRKCLVYQERFIFETDPLVIGRSKQMNNLYYIVEDKELAESQRTYYPIDGEQKMTMRELRELGVPLNQIVG